MLLLASNVRAASKIMLGDIQHCSDVGDLGGGHVRKRGKIRKCGHVGERGSIFKLGGSAIRILRSSITRRMGSGRIRKLRNGGICTLGAGDVRILGAAVFVN